MKKFFVLSLLLSGTVLAQDDRLFDLGFLEGGLSYSVWGMKFEVPPDVCITPIHPNDLQPGQQGITRKAHVGADWVGTLDFSLTARAPVTYLDLLSVSYIARYVPYGDLEQGYHAGIADYELYVEPQFFAYTYTKLDRTDAFAHEVAVNLDLPVGEDWGFTGGCRYLFPFGMKWEQGWDRYAEETEWRSTGAKMRGYAPYIGMKFFDKEAGVTASVLFSKARYLVEWDGYPDSHCESWGLEFGGTVRF